MVSTMKTKSSIQIEDETIQVDPMLPFQRLILLVGKVGEEISEAFCYKLSLLPASLFDKDGLMHEAYQPLLADELSNIVGSHLQTPVSEAHYVVDGGYLLQKIPWTEGKTFLHICHSYIT